MSEPGVPEFGGDHGHLAAERSPDLEVTVAETADDDRRREDVGAACTAAAPRHAANSGTCSTSEIFGPCCHLRPFDDANEAVALVNDTGFVVCALWTETVSHAHRPGRRVDTGIV